MITMYWSRIPGNFVYKLSGKKVTVVSNLGPRFTGTVREWYECLVETMIDAANTERLPHKNVRVSVSHDVYMILCASILFKLGDKEGEGTLSNRFSVKVRPKCENVIFIGDTAKVVVLDMPGHQQSS